MYTLNMCTVISILCEFLGYMRSRRFQTMFRECNHTEYNPSSANHADSERRDRTEIKLLNYQSTEEK